MGVYRLTVFNSNGTGEITVTPFNVLGLYDAGDLISVSVTPGDGFTFVNWQVAGAVVSTSASFTYTMPANDVFLYSLFSGVLEVPAVYGLKYFFEYCPVSGVYKGLTTRIEVQQKDYVGASQQRDIGEVVHRLGNDNSDILENIIGSSLDFELAVFSGNEYDEFLDSDPLKFRIKYFRNYVDSVTYDYIWTGFLITDILERPEFLSVYKIQLTATDRLKILDSVITEDAALLSLKTSEVLVSCLRQTWPDPMPLKEIIQVFETRQNNTLSVLSQISIVLTSLYQEENLFFYDNEGFQLNDLISVKELISKIIRSFVARVFQWNGAWYVVRLMEFEKATLVVNTFTSLGVFDNKVSVSNNQVIDCTLMDNARRTGQLAYSDFEVSLNLGDVATPELNEILVEEFENKSWFKVGDSWKLFRWQYFNSVPFDGVRNSEIARLEFISNPTGGETGKFARFWGTANTITDTSLSYIEFNSLSSNSIIKLAVENANTITFGAKFQIRRRGESDPVNPIALTHSVAFMVKVGTKYLIETSPDVFGWTATVNYVTFPAEYTDVFNTIEIADVTVPEDGEVIIRMVQLVTNTGTRHRYIVDWDGVYLSLSKNESLTYEEVRLKAFAETKYSNSLPNYETYLGDAFTNLSSSAFFLQDVANDPVTELWSRDGIESLPLLNVVIQDIANLLGKNNYRLRTSYYGNIDFTKSIKYDGYNWIINSATLDDYSGRWDLDLFLLNLVTT